MNKRELLIDFLIYYNGTYGITEDGKNIVDKYLNRKINKNSLPQKEAGSVSIHEEQKEDSTFNDYDEVNNFFDSPNDWRD